MPSPTPATAHSSIASISTVWLRVYGRGGTAVGICVVCREDQRTIVIISFWGVPHGAGFLSCGLLLLVTMPQCGDADRRQR